MESDHTSKDTRWAVGWLAFVVVVASGVLLILLGPSHLVTGGNGNVTAVVAFIGVLVTAAVSIIGLTVTRQSNRCLSRESADAESRLSQESADADRRLRLDAAMRAGESFSSSNTQPVDAASIASSLLALTKLDNADLAVALLVNFWQPGIDGRVSTDTAILVVDAALRSGKPSAQLIAAELLCRNSEGLDPCKSLHWPSLIDGCWDHKFGAKTKLLLFDALTRMTLSKRPATERALRSVAVRLYAIYDGEKGDENVRGCIATLINALVPKLRQLDYKNFMQGNMTAKIGDARIGRWPETAKRRRILGPYG